MIQETTEYTRSVMSVQINHSTYLDITNIATKIQSALGSETKSACQPANVCSKYYETILETKSRCSEHTFVVFLSFASLQGSTQAMCLQYV